MDRAEQLQRRVQALEAQGRHQRVASVVLVALLAVSIWMPRSEAQQSSDPLRVRSLIVEDASGQPRVVLGAPLPNDGRTRPSDRRRMGLKGEETGTR
jgi:hypothetical protein